MRLLLALVASTAPAALAGILQVRQDIPPCLQGCIASAGQSANCVLSDVRCLCTNQAFLEGSARCYLAQCPDQVDQGIALGQQLCAAIGISVAVPTQVFASATPTDDAASDAIPISSTSSSEATSTISPAPSSASEVSVASSILSSASAQAPSAVASFASSVSSLVPTSARSDGSALKIPLVFLGVAAGAFFAL